MSIKDRIKECNIERKQKWLKLSEDLAQYEKSWKYKEGVHPESGLLHRIEELNFQYKENYI
jgi:major membrane immunogen (membrane-anchored lipoprotein)